jgi:hypothetical protein
MSRLGSTVLAAAIAAPLATFAQPANLIQNPHFNRDLAGWTTISPGSTTNATYAYGVDRDGANDSGSALVKVIAASPFTIAGILSDCFPVIAGHYYQWSHEVLIPNGQVAGVVQTGLQFATDPQCLNVGNSTFYLDSTSVSGAWVRLSGSGQAPPGSVAAQLAIGPVKTATGGDLDTYVDNARAIDIGCDGRDPATTLCLQKARFAVTAQWQQLNGNFGDGVPVQLTDDSGYFWFFAATNVELVVKVLDACAGPTPRFWAFSSGLTNVEVDLRIEDTKTGQVRNYFNALNTSYPPLFDTNAFTSCP